MRRRVIGMVAVLPLFLPVAAVAAPAPASAGAIETASVITDAITAALQPRLAGLKDATAEIGVIDARLRLPSCPALAVSLAGGTAATMTAKVDCRSPAWTIYVPVRLHAWVDAVVAVANLSPNTSLTADLLSRGRIDMFAGGGGGGGGGVVTDPARVEGKTLRVGLVAGSPILASELEMPLVVHRGQPVLLSITDGTMVIRNSLLALEDGRIGDNIALQNPQSHKIVHATVAGDGSAEIRF